MTDQRELRDLADDLWLQLLAISDEKKATKSERAIVEAAEILAQGHAVQAWLKLNHELYEARIDGDWHRCAQIWKLREIASLMITEQIEDP